jgi:hypothetical protein
LPRAPQTLLHGHTQGRDLGILLPTALVAVGQLLMVWGHALMAEDARNAAAAAGEDAANDGAAAASPPGRGRRGGGGGGAGAARRGGPGAAAVADLVSRRGAFVRALEALLEAPPPPPAPEPSGDDAGAAARAAAAATARRKAEELKEQAFCGLVDLVVGSNGPGLAGIDGVPMEAGRALVARLWEYLEGLLREDCEEEEDEGVADEDDDWDSARRAGSGQGRRLGGGSLALGEARLQGAPSPAARPLTCFRTHPLPAAEDAAPRAAARNAARRAAAARLALRRAEAAAVLGRLVAMGALPREQDEWLGARVVGLLGEARAHPGVAEVARGVCRDLRRVRAAFLPRLYLLALKTAWEQVGAGRGGRGGVGAADAPLCAPCYSACQKHGATDPRTNSCHHLTPPRPRPPQVEDAADPDDAMGPFEELAAAIARTYQGEPGARGPGDH